MTVGDAIAAGLLLTLAAALMLKAFAAFRRYRNPSLILVIGAFLVAFAEGIVIGLLVFGLLPGPGMPLFVVAGVQIVILVLMYAATLPRE